MTAEHAEYYTSVEDYLAGEQVSQQKHEYLAGVIYAMAGTTLGHNLVAGNIYAELRQQLREHPCEVFSSDVRVPIRRDAAEFYYYPDVTIDCGPGDNSSLFVEQPRAIFEVLSPDTERVDRGEKLRNYQSISSLDLYALVDQFHIAITVYRRTDRGWETQFLTRKEDVLDLPSVGCALRLSDVYDRTYLMR